ncbi:MAG: hypothetical protein JJU28_24215 [Cyclobacteriaceae bacterium]|nr:hypothetical protein [Cyclobacteriaceae bacterium]
MKIRLFLLAGLLLAFTHVFAQQDVDDDDEDYDIYDSFESVDAKPVKRYANSKIVGLSPQRFVTLSWDAQLGYDMNFSPLGEFAPDSDPAPGETGRARFTGGMRLNSAIPIISKSSFIWQSGINFMDVRYNIQDINILSEDAAGLAGILNENGLRNLNWTNTFYLPFNEFNFMIIQSQFDMSGDYDFDLQPFNTIRSSFAVLYGKRPNERKQWAVGASRTYRVGNVNYLPIVMYNWTSVDRKWGTEILFPARAHGRYTFNPNSMLLFGYELEGQSYRIGALSENGNSFEIRRGELRPRVDFQRRLVGYFWLGAQAGFRYDWSFDADNMPNAKEFFRGLFGNQPFAMRNNLGSPVYFNVSISFVSP